MENFDLATTYTDDCSKHGRGLCYGGGCSECKLEKKMNRVDSLMKEFKKKSLEEQINFLAIEIFELIIK